jgi:hypothetical protein
VLSRRFPSSLHSRVQVGRYLAGIGEVHVVNRLAANGPFGALKSFVALRAVRRDLSPYGLASITPSLGVDYPMTRQNGSAKR